MLKPSTHSLLNSSKNLLAFSAGGDSTALFFLLLKHKIPFDIAIVDYGIRVQSKEEIAYALELAHDYHVECFVHSAKPITNNFEANARKIRYDFFESLIKKHNYNNLLTAHHLGDRFEWMLMQFCKGAGCVELSGMQEHEKRKNYHLVRPLLHLDKSELLKYLHDNQLKYFEDESNRDEKYQRNYFRHHHSQPLLDKHLEGIKKSFAYLDEDVNDLLHDISLQRIKDFAYFKNSQHQRSNIFAIDKYLKQEGYLLSENDRKSLKNSDTVLISRQIVINQREDYIFIAPYMIIESMPKKFKEKMRILKLEPKLRAYIYKDKEVEKFLTSLLS